MCGCVRLCVAVCVAVCLCACLPERFPSVSPHTAVTIFCSDSVSCIRNMMDWILADWFFTFYIALSLSPLSLSLSLSSPLLSLSLSRSLSLPPPLQRLPPSCKREMSGDTWGRCHVGRRPSSDDSLHSSAVIPPSALDKPSITKRYHRRRTCSHTSPRRSPTMIMLHDARFVECRWWNDGWTVKTVVTWRSLASMIPAPFSSKVTHGAPTTLHWVTR